LNVSPGWGVGSGLGVSGNGVWRLASGVGDGSSLGDADALALGATLAEGEGVGVA